MLHKRMVVNHSPPAELIFNFSCYRLTFFCLQYLIAIYALSPPESYAQTDKLDAAKPNTVITSAKKATAQANPSSKSPWHQLTPTQQQALQPLAGTWESISEAQKRKWLAVSQNYPSLSPEGQATMHSRMNEWVNLSSSQRAEARLNFAKTKELSKQLSPEEKYAEWQKYQSLSDKEKQELAQKARVKPTGAALAVKPIAPQKLVSAQPRGTASSAQTIRMP